MIERIKNIFNLTDQEFKAFVFLIEYGPQSPGDLAKKTGISRPSLYGFMTKLQHVGLVIQSQKNGKKLFIPNTKQKIQILIDEKQKLLEQGRESVEKLFESASKSGVSISPRFQMFEGKEGVRHILHDMLLYKDIETQAYWPIKSMIDILSADFFKTLNKERIRRRLFTRAIWPEKQKVDI